MNTRRRLLVTAAVALVQLGCVGAAVAPRLSARLLGDSYVWSILGAGRHQFNLITMGAIMGGNMRTGMEDNIYLGKGELAQSNGEMVAKAVEATGSSTSEAIIGHWNGLAKYNGYFGDYSFNPNQHNGYPTADVVMSAASSAKDGAFLLAPGYNG